MNFEVSLGGAYQIKQFRDGVCILDTPWISNQILNNAYNYVGGGLTISQDNKLALGTGTTANTKKTTTVQTAIAFTLNATTPNYLTGFTQSGSTITYSGATTFDLTMNATGVISELAITGFSRVILTNTISVNSGDTLTLRYQVTTTLSPFTNVKLTGSDANNAAISGAVSFTPVKLTNATNKSYQWTDLFATWGCYGETTTFSGTTYTPTNATLKTLTNTNNSNQSTSMMTVGSRIMNRASTIVKCNSLYIGNGYAGFIVDFSSLGGIPVNAGKLIIPNITFKLNF